VYSRGGEYPPDSEMQAFDLQTRYLELILNFIGVTDIRSVTVEPTLLNGPEAKAKARAVDKARRLAREF
jgi:FMN-dependent NADH-azoreductase